MKRKVRIYKDPFGQGGYINKTAQWLRKAQEGAETGMTPVTAGIMQQMQPAQQQTMQQQQPQQDPQEQILQIVVALAQQGKGEDEIKDYLLTNVYGFEEGSQEYATYEPQILDFVSAVFERSAPEEEEQAVTNEPIEDIVADTSVEDTSEEDGNYDQMINDIIFDDEEQEARYGGVPNKRSYVNKVIRQLKKAQKGDQVEEANTANVRGTEGNPTSDAPGNKNPFISGVKGQAENHFYKQQAEQMYNNQFNQGMSQEQDDMDYAQRGGWRMRRANRKMFGTPNLPMGVTSSKYSFGPLGGVRNAEVQFNPLMMASMFPMMTFPGMAGGSSWGYNQPYKRTSKGRLVTERIASTVNNQSINDVANATNSEAASNATAGPCTEDQVKDPKSPCYDPMYAGEGPRATDQTPGSGTTDNTVTPGTTPNNGGTGTGTAPFPVDGRKQAMELRNKKDKWGRSPADKWYGFDPATKKWTLTAAPDWYKEPSKKSTVKKDKWGRPETSQWYGYDPKTKKYTLGELKGKTVKEREKLILNKMRNLPEVKKLNAFYSKPQAAQADDELITELVTMGAGSLTNRGVKAVGEELIDFGFKNPNLLEQGAKGALNSGQKLLNPGQKLLNPGQRLLNPGQAMLEAPAGTQFVLPFAAGGFVDNPMQDQFGNLQKFIYGDQVDDQMLENLYQPPINQSDLDYSDSEDPSDPYFKKHGGLHRFDGNADSQTNPTNAPKTYTQEELDKMIAEKQKSWETDYQKKYNQQMQGSGSYGGGYMGGYNPYDSYSAWSSRGNYGGFGPMASTGLLGATGNLIKGFGRGPSTYGPAGNPLQYAATAAAITNSGMLPTGMRYSKEKGSGLLGKLGLKNDKVWTLDYATPDQIKAGAIPGAQGTAPGTNQSTSNMSGRDRRIARRDEQNNKGIQPMSNEEMLKSQGKTWDEQQKKWVSSVSPVSATNTSPTKNTERDAIINAPDQQSNIHAFPGPDMSNIPSGSNMIQDQVLQALFKSRMAYGGFIPDYMAYGGDLPTADNGINFSTVSYGPNSITQPGGIGQGQTGPCTEEEVKDPNSPCYDPMYAGQGPRVADKGPQTAQLKIKEEKGKMDPTRLSRGVLDFGANLADDQDYLTERRNKYIPGMTEFAMGEKQTANEVINKGEWNARTGKEGIQGFEGVIRKGGAIKSKKSKAGGHKINISDFQDLMRLAGLK